MQNFHRHFFLTYRIHAALLTNSCKVQHLQTEEDLGQKIAGSKLSASKEFLLSNLCIKPTLPILI